MSIKIGALVVDLQGFQLTAEEKELLAHPLVGGVILFTRNYENPAQLKTLCTAIRAVRTLPLLIMADQEGGRVQRFRHGFYPLPPLSMLGERYEQNPELALQLTKTAGWLMATELLDAGLDFSLAPVVDMNKGISNVIGTRAFHADANIVFRLAETYMLGMKEAGMSATIKHFPGHGSVSVDSHLDTPVDTRELNVILEDDIRPFQQLIRAGVPAIMAAHIIFPQVDKLQVGFSRVWLHDILRQRLNFTGLIMSDCLSMKGADISSHYADRMLAAREAGCDMALVCNNRQGVIEILDTLPLTQHQLDESKWRPMQANLSLQQNMNERSVQAKNFLQKHHIFQSENSGAVILAPEHPLNF